MAKSELVQLKSELVQLKRELVIFKSELSTFKSEKTSKKHHKRYNKKSNYVKVRRAVIEKRNMIDSEGGNTANGENGKWGKRRKTLIECSIQLLGDPVKVS